VNVRAALGKRGDDRALRAAVEQGHVGDAVALVDGRLRHRHLRTDVDVVAHRLARLHLFDRVLGVASGPAAIPQAIAPSSRTVV